MARRRYCRLTLLCALLFGTALWNQVLAAARSPTSAGARVVVLSTNGPYGPAAEKIAAALRAKNLECRLLTLVAGDLDNRNRVFDQLRELKPDVVAAAGASITEQTLNELPGVPIVFFMTPNALDVPFMADNHPTRKRVTGVTSDVDPTEQIDWIVRTHPRARRITVLCSARSEKTAAALATAGRKRGVTVTRLFANRDEFPKAIERLNGSDCDGVLMIPDAQVYNSPNVQRLLIWGARQKKPVWSFSRNVVKAGAFAGLHCNADDISKQTAELIQQVIGGRAPSAIELRYTRNANKAVNGATAETIGAQVSQLRTDTEIEWFGKKP